MSLKTEIALLKRDIKDHDKEIEDIKKNYVRNETFLPVKAIAFGIITLIALAVGGALIKLII